MNKCNYIGITCNSPIFASAFALMFFPIQLRKIYIHYIFGNSGNKIPDIKYPSKGAKLIEYIRYYLSIILKKALYNTKYQNYDKICENFKNTFWEYVMELGEKEKKQTHYSYIKEIIKRTKKKNLTSNDYPIHLDEFLLPILHNMFNIPIPELRSYEKTNMFIFYEELDFEELTDKIMNLHKIPMIYLNIYNYNGIQKIYEYFNFHRYYFFLQGMLLKKDDKHSISIILCNQKWYIVDNTRANMEKLPILPINNIKNINYWKGYKTTENITFDLKNIEDILLCYTIVKK